MSINVTWYEMSVACILSRNEIFNMAVDILVGVPCWLERICTYLWMCSNGSKIFIFDHNGKYRSNFRQSIVMRNNVVSEVGVAWTGNNRSTLFQNGAYCSGYWKLKAKTWIQLTDWDQQWSIVHFQYSWCKISHIFRDRQPCKWTNLPLEFDLVQRQVDDFCRQQPNCLYQHQPFAYRTDTWPAQRRDWILRKYARISSAFSIWRSIPIHRCTITPHCWFHWPLCGRKIEFNVEKREKKKNFKWKITCLYSNSQWTSKMPILRMPFYAPCGIACDMFSLHFWTAETFSLHPLRFSKRICNFQFQLFHNDRTNDQYRVHLSNRTELIFADILTIVNNVLSKRFLPIIHSYPIENELEWIFASLRRLKVPYILFATFLHFVDIEEILHSESRTHVENFSKCKWINFFRFDLNVNIMHRSVNGLQSIQPFDFFQFKSGASQRI